MISPYYNPMAGDQDQASYSDESFVTLDAYHSPGKMPPGHLLAAENCLIQGGDLISRPGRLGLLAAPHGAPAFVLGAFRRADGTTAVLYTSGGKLYRLDKGASAPVEVLGAGGASLALASANAFGTRLGKYFYICDGAGPLVRTDLSSALAAPFLSAPAVAPVAALTSTVIDPLAGGAWTPDALTGAGQVNRLPNSDFSGTYAAPDGLGNLPTGWAGYGSTPDDGEGGGSGPPAGYTGHWLNQDTPGDGIYNVVALANDPVAGDPARYACQFYFAVDTLQFDKSGASSLVVRVEGYSDAAGTAPLGQVTREFTLPYNGGQAVTVGNVFSFAPFVGNPGAAPVLAYRVFLQAGEANALGKMTAVYVKNWVCFPFAAALTAPVTGGQVEVIQPGRLAYTGGTLAASAPGTVGAGVGAGGARLTRDFGAAQNWSAYSHVVLGLSRAAGIAGLSLALAFREAGSSVRYLTNPFDISADGTMATCDISTVPASALSAFRYLEIVFGGDFTVPAANGADLLLFGPMTGAGSLSIGYADYSYVVTEVNAATDPSALVNVLEGNPGPATGPLTPTVTQAEGAVTLPAPENTSATHFAVYRYGGVFQDNPAVGRLVAVVPAGADVAFGADARNPSYAWNHAARLLTDDTPDSFLLAPGRFPNPGTPLAPGRDAPPSGAQAICEYHGRILLAVGSAVYISWLADVSAPDVLYFTQGAVLPGDPNAAVKGATFTIGGQFSNDPIQALVPHNTSVVADTHTRKTLIEGYDGTNFAAVDYLKDGGYGCVAPRAALLMDNQQATLCASGPFLFDGAAAGEFGLLVESLMIPRGFDGSPALSADALAGAAMVYHDRRLLLSVPDPGQAAGSYANTRAYVYDTRNKAWTRWGFGFTSGVSLSSGTDAGSLYLGGADGQVYTLSGSQDQAGPSAPPAPIPLLVTTRGFGQGNVYQFWREDKARRVYLHAGLPAGTPVTVTVASDLPDNFQTLPAYSFSLPYQEFPSATEGVRGHSLTVSAAISVSGPARIYGIRLACAETSVKQ